MGSSLFGPECLLDPVGGVSVQLWVDMGVGVLGDADLRVAEDLNHDTGRDALGHENAGGGVSQLVRRESTANAKTQAVISADKGVEYGRVVEIIDTVKHNGVSSFALDIERGPAPPTAPIPVNTA